MNAVVLRSLCKTKAIVSRQTEIVLEVKRNSFICFSGWLLVFEGTMKGYMPCKPLTNLKKE